jgi:aryl-alcohol dehydrogenase-like predicted oxidoreductase
MKRREFLKSSLTVSTASALGAAPAIASGKEEPAAGEPPRIQRYQPLGNTGFKMSDISFGTGRLSSPSLFLRALERGINYFDTAPDYGQAEEHMGKVLATYDKRDEIFIASKFCDPVPYQAGVSHLQLPKTKAEYIAAVEGSLKRLNTDRLDVVFVHAIGELEDREREQNRLLDENMLAAVESLKKAGKIRYLACSSHGPHGLEPLLTQAIESGHFDLVMPAFNFMSFPKLPEVIKAAKAKGMGVVAMKTLAGAKEMELEPGESPFEHAAFKWVLQHPEVSGLIVTFKNFKDLDHYVAASGGKLAAVDQTVLDRYAARFGADYCRTGCGDCESACPSSVRIATILRYQMYFDDYGEEKKAIESYAALGSNIDACANCTTIDCDRACPHGLPVRSKLEAANRSLTLA